MMRLSAPVRSMNAICSSEAATISDTENDRINPAHVDRRTTSTEVLKNRHVTTAIINQPINPLTSAGLWKNTSMTKMATIGNSVQNRGNMARYSLVIWGLKLHDSTCRAKRRSNKMLPSDRNNVSFLIINSPQALIDDSCCCAYNDARVMVHGSWIWPIV